MVSCRDSHILLEQILLGMDTGLEVGGKIFQWRGLQQVVIEQSTRGLP